MVIEPHWNNNFFSFGFQLFGDSVEQINKVVARGEFAYAPNEIAIALRQIELLEYGNEATRQVQPSRRNNIAVALPRKPPTASR